MPTINYETRQKIVAQALSEISFARDFKQGKTRQWRVNEQLYYGRKTPTTESRANVDLGQMSSFVHTVLSKVDNPLVFKFLKRKEAQLMRAKRLNSLRMYDAQRDDWDIKDLVGKKQALIYGRAIYSYYADSQNGYQPHLENVDVYDFLVDPSAGGLDLERAMYLGRYGVIKSREDLKKGIKDKYYLKTETNTLLEGSGNATDENQEKLNAQFRTQDQNVWQAQKNISNSDKFVFWEWYTTFEGERYYLLVTDRGSQAVRIEKLSDIFETNLYPFWTWACSPDLTEFWTPSYCDYVREVFMAQSVSINQMLDNSEQINKPTQVINVGSIENLAELKYRKGGNQVKVKKDFDITKAVQELRPPAINAPIQVYNLLEAIQEKASGVTAGAKGVSDEDKVGIYEGNQANAADRFGLLNKSYSFGYKRFAQLYEAGVREHLSVKIAIEILGPNGVQVDEVSRRDIFRKGETFAVMVESSDAEEALSEVDKKNKITFLNGEANNQTMNGKKAFELKASIAGFNEEEIRQLLDVSEFGDAELMSEAENDIETILEGRSLKPNQAANVAYKQRVVDYMMLNSDNLKDEQFQALARYVKKLQPIIDRNMIRQANDMLHKQQIMSLTIAPKDNTLQTKVPGPTAPSNVVDPAADPALMGA